MASLLDDDEQGIDYVKLVSAENHEFFIERKVAMKSATISAMLSGSFQESSGVVRFPEIGTEILEKVSKPTFHLNKTICHKNLI